MGEARRRKAWEQFQLDNMPAYLHTVLNISTPCCSAQGMEVVDLFTDVPGYRESDMPPGARYLCARCGSEFDLPLPGTPLLSGGPWP